MSVDCGLEFVSAFVAEIEPVVACSDDYLSNGRRVSCGYYCCHISVMAVGIISACKDTAFVTGRKIISWILVSRFC